MVLSYIITMENIILLGPIAAGKTSVGELLAQNLGKDFIDIDERREKIYETLRYSSKRANFLYKMFGIKGWYFYQKKFELASVKIILNEGSDRVISFGAGQAVYHSGKMRREFCKLIENNPNIFLLMPFKSSEQTLKLLNQRMHNNDEIKLNKIFVKSYGNFKFAKHLIYTEYSAVSEIAQKIAEKII